MRSIEVSVATFLLPLSLMAAISPNHGDSRALEVLNMSVASQDQVEVDEKTAAQFWQIAFDDKQSMSIRWRALVLGMKANPDSKMISKARTHKDWFIRNAVLSAAAKYKTQMLGEIARSMLQDQAMVVRSAAVDALSKFEDLGTRMALWSELQASRNFIKGQSLWIRPQIAKILSATPQKDEMKIFADLLHDSDSAVVSSAMDALEVYTGMKSNKTSPSYPERLAFWRKQASVIK